MVFGIAGLTTFILVPRILSISHPRGPYLQSVTPDSVWVVWDTTQPVKGRVEYGTTQDLDFQLEESKSTLHHEDELKGLMPYTLYYYRVDQGEIYSFRTAASPDQTHFRFTVFGDTRSGNRVHKRIVQKMLELSPDFVLHTGDLVEFGGVKSEWDNFFKIEKDLLSVAPLFPTLGNHEDYDQKLFDSHYLDVFHLPGNELWYTFDYGNARFICLKADGYPIDIYFPDEQQLNWLEEQLADNKAQWLFVFFHVGIFTSRSEDFLETGMRQRLAPIFKRYEVDAVFMGHHHSYERIIENGTTYLIVAGGGAPLYDFEQPEPGSQVALLVHHFLEIEINNKLLLGRVIDDHGQVIDSFQLQAKE